MITLNDIDNAIIRLLGANQKEIRDIEAVRIQVKTKDKVLPMVLKKEGIFLEDARG